MAYDWTNWLPSGLTKDEDNTSNASDWRIWLPRTFKGTSQEVSLTKNNRLVEGSGERVFLSYASKDYDDAKRLYDDLKSANFTPWLDKESLRAGQTRDLEVRKAIRKSRYFIPLLSHNYVGRGIVQAQLKDALDVLKEFPESDTYIIPVRLDDCDISNEELEEIIYVDLFPRWEEGLKKILSAMNTSPEK